MKDALQNLWNMVNSCETHEDIQKAIKVLDHADIDADRYDELMDSLAYLSRELYRRRK